jgi:hypothetical protein
MGGGFGNRTLDGGGRVMSYKPKYLKGELVCVENERGGQFGLFDDNKDYQEFKLWLTNQDKTLEQWLAENPEVIDIDAAKQQKCIALKAEIESRLSSHYSPLDLLSLSNLLTEAKVTGKTNRAAYLEPLSMWAIGVYSLFYAAQAALASASTVDEIDAVSIDYAAWEAQKPTVTFVGAMAIAD